MRRQTELAWAVAQVTPDREPVDAAGRRRLHHWVARLDRLSGGTVTAIFDIRSYQPFVVRRQQETESGDAVGEVLGRDAYAVLELDG
jgi:hypothetical protein